jgi:hypothetical protein
LNGIEEKERMIRRDVSLDAKEGEEIFPTANLDVGLTIRRMES